MYNMYKKSVKKLFDFDSDETLFQVTNKDFYKEIYWNYTLGLGESYINRFFEIDTDNLIKLCKLFYEVFADYKLYPNDRFENPIINLGYSKKLVWNWICRNVVNFQKIRPLYYADIHYNISNDLFQKMLGETLAYSCGYWKDLEMIPSNLDLAQNAKFELIRNKLDLKAGDVIINFGSGWGSLEKYLSKLGVVCIGINISKEQLKFSRDLFRDTENVYFVETNLLSSNDEWNLKNIISPILKTYGKHEADHVISIGAWEHVGIKNYKNLFLQLKNAIKFDGLMLIHTIGAYFDMSLSDPFIEKYVFPDTRVPTISEITKSSEKVGLKVLDYHNFEQESSDSYYATTLRAWMHNFQETCNSIDFDETFNRQWIFYLCLCIGLFESKKVLTLSQYIFKKTINTKPYLIKK